MSPEQAKELVDKYVQGNASPEEIRLVEDFYLKKTRLDAEFDIKDLSDNERASWKALARQIDRKPISKVSVFSLPMKLGIAASIALMATLGYFWQYHISHQVTSSPSLSLGGEAADAEPGGNKAIVILPDGSKHVLGDDEAEIRSMYQGGELVCKVDDGVLYANEVGQTAVSGIEEERYQTIITPNGGQFKVILPDGTKVWLNAASSLKYPVAFSENSRKVYLEGEAYFEVTKSAAAPFVVKSKKQSVTVLGTHFNVNTYLDEKVIRTTLLEGSVSVRDDSKGQEVLIKPGEQLELTGQMNVRKVDVANAVAWKDGLFDFSESGDVPSVMRQLIRWYDIEVEYKGDIPKKEFRGKISKKVKASDIIELLQYAGINCRLEKRNGETRLIVL